MIYGKVEGSSSSTGNKVIQIAYLREVRHYRSLDLAVETGLHHLNFTSMRSLGKEKIKPEKIVILVENAITKDKKLVHTIETKDAHGDVGTIIRGLEETLKLGVRRVRVNSDLKKLMIDLNKGRKTGKKIAG